MSLPSTFIQSQEPIELWAGVSAAWNKSLPDFPASDSWQLSYTLTPPTGNAIAVAWTTHVSANGSAFAVSIPASLTTSITAGGSGRLTGKVTKSSDTAIVYDATLTWKVLGERSLAQRILDLIDGMMLVNAPREDLELSLQIPSGVAKALKLLTPEQLQAKRNYWLQIRNAEVASENSANGRSRRRILNRYTSPR